MNDGAGQRKEPAAPAGPRNNETSNAIEVTSPFFQGTDWLSFGVTAVVVLAIHLSTLAPEVTLGISGLLATSAKYAGVAHPPGYPLWTVYSWLFVTLLPFSNIAWRVAVGSAVAASMACGLVALMVSRAGTILLQATAGFSSQKPAEQKVLSVVCGYVAGTVLGLSRTVWSVAVVAETWAISILLFAIMLCLLMRWTTRPQRRRFLYGALFMFGLLLTSNQELFVMIPALLVLVILSDQKLGRDLSLVVSLLAVIDWAGSALGLFHWPGSHLLVNVGLLVPFLLVGVAAVVAIVKTRRFGSEWKSASLCGILFLLGLGWYCYLPFASMTNPPSNWAYARTVDGFFYGVTRGQFEQYHPTNELGPFFGQLWRLVKETAKGFGWLFLGFAVLPYGLLRRMDGCSRNWLLGLAAALVCVGPLMLVLLNPSADRASLECVDPFFAAMYVVLALCAGLGLVVVGGRVARTRTQPPPLIMPPSGPASWVIKIISPHLPSLSDSAGTRNQLPRIWRGNPCTNQSCLVR